MTSRWTTCWLGTGIWSDIKLYRYCVQGWPVQWPADELPAGLVPALVWPTARGLCGCPGGDSVQQASASQRHPQWHRRHELQVSWPTLFKMRNYDFFQQFLICGAQALRHFIYSYLSNAGNNKKLSFVVFLEMVSDLVGLKSDCHILILEQWSWSVFFYNFVYRSVSCFLLKCRRRKQIIINLVLLKLKNVILRLKKQKIP